MRTITVSLFVFAVFAIAGCAFDNDESASPALSTSYSALEPGVPGAQCSEDGASTSCYTGAAGTMGVGLCSAGTQKCIASKYTACMYQVVPALEVCDGEDNDCDALTDESLGQTVCGLGACVSTVDNCVAGVETICQWEADMKAEPEVCDGLDNDCDNAVDDDQAGEPIVLTCYTGGAGTEGVGLCHGGTQSCVDGALLGCEGQVVPTTDLCDGLDNDCDGSADEGYPTVGDECNEGAGQCFAEGVFVCNAAGTGVDCDAEPTDPGVEVCDGVDNDCDAAVDENALGQALTQTCYTGAAGTSGVGLCHGGVQTCAGGVYGSCVGQVVPSAETCDGLDNDCDAGVDENALGSYLTVSCYNGAAGTLGVGSCHAGYQLCVDAELYPVCIDEDVPDASETCFNSIDDDCDGSVDEGCQVPCADTDGDTYGVGCASGVDCDDSDAEVNPDALEWCGDGVDNNCNGLEDELQCFSAGNGQVVVSLTLTGACDFDSLILTKDFANITNPAIVFFDSQAGFAVTEIANTTLNAVDGLHRFNVEFDTNGFTGDEMMYVTQDQDSVVVHDECGELRFFYEGVEVEYTPMLDPRQAVDANAFVCLGATSGCYLCGGDWENDGVLDCAEGGAWCDQNVYDSLLCP